MFANQTGGVLFFSRDKSGAYSNNDILGVMGCFDSRPHLVDIHILSTSPIVNTQFNIHGLSKGAPITFAKTPARGSIQ
jgi:hypothetical protein